VANVIDSLAEYNDAKKKHASHTKTAAVKNEPPAPVTGSILYDPKTEPLTLKGAAADPKKKDDGGTLGSFSGTLAGLGKIMGGGDSLLADKATQSGQKSKAFMNITSPEHENQLQQIKSRGVLNDLILNDPVISGYDPHEVAQAYNQIAELAPNFTGSNAAMQAMLRKRLEAGQLADFDVKQILELEKTRAESLKSNLEAQEKARQLL
jgi:hypothetical protein